MPVSLCAQPLCNRNCGPQVQLCPAGADGSGVPAPPQYGRIAGNLRADALATANVARSTKISDNENPGEAPADRVFPACSHQIARLGGEGRTMSSSASGVQAQAGRLEARLLVVEDEPTILELLSGSLRFAGFDVMTAASGREALRVAAASRPDLILLDVML